MSSGLVSLFFGAGVAGWVYTQLARRSGNANPSSTYIAAAGAGVFAWIIFFTVFKFILHF